MIMVVTLIINMVSGSNAVPEVESEKLILAQKGDTQAFTELVDAYQVAVYNLCYRMLGDPYAAEDASQETFIRAYKAMKTFDRKRSFSTWFLEVRFEQRLGSAREGGFIS